MFCSFYHPRGGSRRLLLHPSPQRVSVGTLRDHREDCESAGCSSVKFTGRGLLKPAGHLSVKLAGCGSLKPAGRCSFKFAGHSKVKFAGRCSLKPASRSDVKPAGRASRQPKVHSRVGSSPRVCVKKPLTRITPCPLEALSISLVLYTGTILVSLVLSIGVLQKQAGH